MSRTVQEQESGWLQLPCTANPDLSTRQGTNLPWPQGHLSCPVSKVGQRQKQMKTPALPSLSKGAGKSLVWFGTEGCPVSLVSPGWHHSWHTSTAETSHSSVKGTKASSEAALRAGSLAHGSFPPSAVHHLPRLCVNSHISLSQLPLFPSRALSWGQFYIYDRMSAYARSCLL